nr:DUF6461 domain-containing protein [Motilibacter aurantiacus]
MLLGAGTVTAPATASSPQRATAPTVLAAPPISGALAEKGSPSVRPASYAWAEQGALGEGACVTFVTNTGARTVLREYGAVPERRMVPAEDAFWSGFDSVAVATAGRSAVLVSDNSFECTRPEVLRAVSRGGRAVSVFWNVEYDNAFSYAVDGRVVTSFDMLDGTVSLTTGANAALKPFLSGLSLSRQGMGIPAGLAIAERITGARLTAADVKAMTHVHLMSPLLSDLPRPDPTAPPAFDWDGDRERAGRLTTLLRAAPPGLQRRAAAYVVRQAVTRAGFATRPAVRAALPRLASSRPPALRGPLQLQVRDALAAESAVWMRSTSDGPTRADRRLLQQGRAMQALHAATNRNAELAAFGAARAARSSLEVAGVDVVPLLEAYLTAG